ncbi:MAG: flagellar basal-body rod protein FlgF, partial [Hyphomicrobiales bacterium]|nr:flagellar basal-body rod protein FlgF [Hyphomicrobiales bacterium]
LETIAQNLSHISTTGYRAERVDFSSYISLASPQPVAYVTTGERTYSLQSGALQKTGNPLDVAVKGTGWLAVQTPSGIAYSRDGRLQMDPQGALLTITGFPILDAGGAPLRLDPAGRTPTIAADGSIRQGEETIGAIGLFQLPDSAKLTRGAGSTIVSDTPATPLLTFTTDGIMQGYTEASNVNPIKQITRLIAVQRAFEMISGGLEQTHRSSLDAIKTMGSGA